MVYVVLTKIIKQNQSYDDRVVQLDRYLYVQDLGIFDDIDISVSLAT